MFNQLKKSAFVALGFVVCMTTILMTGCQSKNEEKEISMFDLQQTMLEADADFPEMSTVNSASDDADQLFAYVSDMDYELVNSFCLAYSSEGKADEFAVIQVKNKDDVETAIDSLKKHKEDRVKLYQNYDASQVQRASDAMIFSEGNFAVLIISDNASEVKKAFESFIGE